MQGFSKTDIDAYVQDQAMYASARSQVCVCVCVCVEFLAVWAALALLDLEGCAFWL